MKKLASFQKMADKITTLAGSLGQLLADLKGTVVLGLQDGQTMGFVHFFQHSRAFAEQSGRYIDAFLVDDPLRAKRLGKA